MAVGRPRDPLDRARQVARTEPQPGWARLHARVMELVRAGGRPTFPVAVLGEGGALATEPDGSRTRVSSKVLVDVLRRRLDRPTHVPADIDLVVDEDDRLREVRVGLVVAYGEELGPLGDRARAAVLADLRGVLGTDPAFGPDQVLVEIVDVVRGDPGVV